MTLAEVEACTILKCVVGSTAHGLETGDDDRDELGVCIEPYAVRCALDKGWKDTLVYRTATERTGKVDAKSQPGDLDLTVHSLKKYLSLALTGNPTVLLLLFSGKAIVRTKLGEELQALASDIVSLEAVEAFLEYMNNQWKRLTGERGQKGVNRPELVAKYGFDTKYAGHVIRLGYQGLEIAETGKLQLPMTAHRQYIVDVRTGKVSYEDVVAECEKVHTALKRVFEKRLTDLPPEPNRKRVGEWMLEAYWRTWHGSV